MKLKLILLVFFLFHDLEADQSCSHLFFNFNERSFHNSKYEFINAIRLIQETIEIIPDDTQSGFYSSKKNQIFVSTKVLRIIPKDLLSLHWAVSNAALYMGMNEQMRWNISNKVLQEASPLYGVKWQDIKSLFSELNLQSTVIRSEVLSLLDHIIKTTEVNFDYDIPYLAGYSKSIPNKVYIDRYISKYIHIHHSRINIIPLIIAHERIEKSLIDTLNIKKDEYVASHQIAQRLEKIFAHSLKIDWNIYQNVEVQIEIERAESPYRKIRLSPEDLDYLPYLENKDSITINRLKQTAQSNSKNNLFEYKIIKPGVLHLNFYDQKKMAWTLMRFQEYYESPVFKGKIFSRKKFLNWFRHKKNGYDSYSEWDGFNFPMEVLKLFYQGKFNPLTENERQFLKVLKNFKHTSFYIIATVGEPNLKHEIAHALFYLNTDYKKEVLKALSEYDLTPIEHFLKNEMGDYHDSVIIDEIHAYIAHEREYMIERGFDFTSYDSLKTQLLSIFNRYALE